MTSKKENLFFNKIVQKDWLQLHPLKLQSTSDFYYIQLSNKILNILLKDKNVSEFPISLKRKFAIITTAYFEDIISNVGLWRAIRQIHFEKQCKLIPFKNLTDDYQLDEINPEDIQFLIWTLVQRDVLERDDLMFINIENPIISYVSLLIYEVLDDEYETAPENEAFHDAVHSAQLTSDYFLFREFLKWLHYDSYLSCPYPKNQLQDELKKTKSNQFVKENIDVLKYTLIYSLIFTNPCSPFAIPASKWLAEIVSDSNVKNIARAIEYKTFTNYKIVSTNDKLLKIKLLDGGDELFELNRDSLEHSTDIDNKNVISSALTYFNGMWNVNGMAAFGDEEDNFNPESKKVKGSKTNENDQLTYDFVLKNNNNFPIAYFKNTKDLSFFLLKLFPNSNDKELIPSNIKSDSNFVVFTHPNIGLVMYPDLAKWINDKNNLCYNKQSASDNAVSILCGGYKCQREFIEYLIQNNLIPDARINSLNGVDYGRTMVQDNMDFIIRFFQPELFSKRNI